MDNLKVTRLNNIIYGPPLKQEINETGLGRYIFDLMRKNAKKTFQINAVTGEEQTYKDFNKKCIRVALQLQKRGIGKQDIVLLLTQNSMDGFIPIVASFYINAIINTLDPSISTRDISHLVKLTKPNIIFTVKDSLEAIRKILRELSMNIDVVIMQSDDSTEDLTLAQFLVPNQRESEFVPEIVDDPRETAFVLFSSGTTGLPKPIKCSHFGLLYTVTGEMMCGYDCEVIMHYNSFHWISAYLLTMFVLIKGGRKVIPDDFEPKKALEYFDKYKVTTILLPSTFLHKFTSASTRNNSSKYPKHLIFGGSGLSPDSLRKIFPFFPNSQISFVYGLTEVTGFITNNAANYELYKMKFGSVGTINPGLDFKIVDLDTEEPLPPNKHGEIRLFTKAFFNGYGNENNEECYDREGFLKTGDVGYYDEDNCLYITDRIKEMFKYQSWPIIPNSLENILYKHPAVHEAIVVGIPHETDGHQPMGVVILKEKYENVTSSDIEKFFDEQVDEREKLRAGLLLVKMLPKTPSGKVMRKHIRDLIISGKHEELQDNIKSVY